jgi:hypothetical protein
MPSRKSRKLRRHRRKTRRQRGGTLSIPPGVNSTVFTNENEQLELIASKPERNTNPGIRRKNAIIKIRDYLSFILQSKTLLESIELRQYLRTLVPRLRVDAADFLSTDEKLKQYVDKIDNILTVSYSSDEIVF